MIFRIVLMILLTAPVFTGMASAQWEWVNPSPNGNNYNALSVSGGEYAVTTGTTGALLEFPVSGGSPSALSLTANQMYDVDIHGDYGVAAGEANTVLLRNSGGWYQSAPASDHWFYGAAVLPDGQAWVCGDLGKIYHFDGVQWTLESSNTSSTFKDIELVNSSFGFAVGLYGTARKYDGAAWNYISSQTTRFLRKISLFDTSHGWAVGDLGTILLWNGTSFAVETSPVSTSLYGVCAVDDTEAWAVGDAGTILHRTAGVWSETTIPGIPVTDLRGVDLDSEGNIWVAGKFGMVAKYDGSDWVPLVDDPTDRLDFYDIEYVDDRFYLAGENGAMWTLSGGMMTPDPTGQTASLSRVHYDAWGTLWATGTGGLLMTREASGWQTVPIDTTDDLKSIHVLGPDSLWVAGGCSDGTCVSWTAAYFDGDDWTVYSDSGT